MPSITETLCAIERRAERAIVQELRLVTQEILTMRTQLMLEDRAHADALLLKLSHLESCQRVEPVAPSAPPLCLAPTESRFPSLALDMLEPLQPSAYLVQIYGQGETTDFVYRVVRGTVRTSHFMADGRRPIGDFYYDGDKVVKLDWGDGIVGCYLRK